MVPGSRDPRLESSAVRERYSDPNLYTGIDSWHRFTSTVVRREISRRWSELSTGPGRVILNAGAGNNDLGICPPTTINLDISETGLQQLPNPLVASVEAIPLGDETVDSIICVGGVINYCDAAAAISEFARILRENGSLVLEFDSSLSAELMFQKAFGRSVAVAESFYADRPEAVWVYSAQHIANLLSAAGLCVTRTIPVHIASPWAFLLTRSIPIATALAHLDPLFRFPPFLSRWASNYLLFCRKGTS
jgi:ubiquinone/menaquinone biosynthesis C-methylase UbiE